MKRRGETYRKTNNSVSTGTEEENERSTLEPSTRERSIKKLIEKSQDPLLLELLEKPVNPIPNVIRNDHPEREQALKYQRASKRKRNDKLRIETFRRIRQGPKYCAKQEIQRKKEGHSTPIEIPWEVDPHPEWFGPDRGEMTRALRTREEYFEFNPVINLSTYVLSETQRQILKKGKGFVPRPEGGSGRVLAKGLRKFIRTILWQEFMERNDDKSRSNTGHPYPGKKIPMDKYNLPQYASTHMEAAVTILENLAKELDECYCNLSQIKDNLTKTERWELDLLCHKEFQRRYVFRSVDKGTGIVLADREDYLAEIHRQLQQTEYYVPLGTSSVMQVHWNRIKEITNTLLEEGKLDRDTATLLQEQPFEGGPERTPRPRTLYTLAKVHKPIKKWTIPFRIPPGRPVCSDVSSECTAISEWIDRWLQPIAQSYPSYTQDSYDFFNKITKLDIAPGSFIVTFDVTSMYTNIDHKLGLRAIRRALERYRRNNPEEAAKWDRVRPDDSTFLEIMSNCLHNNDFYINGEFFLQVKGTAMGKKFAPSYANTVMGEWEMDMIYNPESKVHELVLYRYIDDGFIYWPGTLLQLKIWLEYVNSDIHWLSQCFKLEIEFSPEGGVFLDMNVWKNQYATWKQRVKVQLYRKTTDTQDLLQADSFHPPHVAAGIFGSQVTRFNRLHTDRKEAWQQTEGLIQKLVTRNYPKKMLHRVRTKIYLLHDALMTDGLWSPQRIQGIVRAAIGEPRPMSVEFKPKLPKFSETVAFQGPCQKQAQMLERQHMKQNRCQMCLYLNPSLGREITVTSTQERYTLPATGPGTTKKADGELLNCGSKNVIYLVQCEATPTCRAQYVGETGQSLRNRFNNHRHAIRKGENAPGVAWTGLAVHMREAHGLHHDPRYFGSRSTTKALPMTVYILAQLELRREDPEEGDILKSVDNIMERREMEAMFIDQFQTVHPQGMNLRAENPPMVKPHPLVLPHFPQSKHLKDLTMKVLMKTLGQRSRGGENTTTPIPYLATSMQNTGPSLLRIISKANVCQSGKYSLGKEETHTHRETPEFEIDHERNNLHNLPREARQAVDTRAMIKDEIFNGEMITTIPSRTLGRKDSDSEEEEDSGYETHITTFRRSSFIRTALDDL